VVAAGILYCIDAWWEHEHGIPLTVVAAGILHCIDAWWERERGIPLTVLLLLLGYNIVLMRGGNMNTEYH